MKDLDKLNFAADLMEKVNEIHGETFLDIQVDPEEMEVTFDMQSSSMVYAIHISLLLNVTYYSEARGNKVIHTIQP
jgi:hypothetical protein